MTLYIKGTDTMIVGNLEHLTGTAQVNALNDDGSIAWGGGTIVDWNSQTTVLDQNQPVWIDDENSEYRGVEVEDRRDDGMVVAFKPLHSDPLRPVTKRIRTLWILQVGHGLTELGLKDFGEEMTTQEWLNLHHLILAPRDPYINAASKGEWQITQPYDKLDHPEQDASNLGFFAIVGDNVEDLSKEALDWAASF